MSLDPRYFATQRTSSISLDRNNFTNVLTLDVDSIESVRRQLVNLNAMVQVHFTAPANTALDYTILLRLRRLRRGDSCDLTTLSLDRSFVSGTGTNNRTSHSENLNLTWTDVLSRRTRHEGLDEEDFENDLEISNCRDRDCDRDRGDVRYQIAVSFNTNNSLIGDIEVRQRSLTGIVFPAGGREGRRGFDFLF